MKIILSRKGFDSSAGGVPSPILPDGSLLSLPIPDQRSTIRYRDIHSPHAELAQLVSDLTAGRIKPTSGAHLDPDLCAAALPRQPDWRPLFGQNGSAQGHLRNQGVAPGDVFLFFGLFQAVEKTPTGYRFIKQAPRQHRLFGWLQIDFSQPVESASSAMRRWAGYHPHFNHPPGANNTLYLATKSLRLPANRQSTLPGAGLFSAIHPDQLLTAANAPSPSLWQLPGWLFPTPDKPPLSYHANPTRWQRKGNHVLLRAASRGQEFVLNCDHYPEAIPWLRKLLKRELIEQQVKAG